MVTTQLSHVLPGTGTMRYHRQVPATLRSLDVFIGLGETDDLVRQFGRRLSKPLKFKPHKPNALVYAQVVPEDLDSNPYYLSFHADADDNVDAPKADRLLTIHMDYELRPPGPVPRGLLGRRSRGQTVRWVEKNISELAGNALMFVEATLELKQWRRCLPLPGVPPLEANVSLKLSGLEYRAKRELGKVSRFRWSERYDGPGLDVSISYSYATKKIAPDIWVGEEKRCRRHLRTLL